MKEFKPTPYRNRKIFKLRDKGYTLLDIAEKVDITPERVRQIIEEKSYRVCKIHRIRSKDVCRYCFVKKNYIKRIKEITSATLMDEIARLSKQDRRKEVVAQRQALVRILRDKYKFNFLEIADLLERDQTSIVHLYHKKLSI